MRKSEIKRKTKETDIVLELNIDGTGTSNIHTGIGFFDHMLESFSKHSGFDINVTCTGDLQVDYHHTVEDVGIVLGTAFAKCTENKAGLKRFGASLTPMDETLAEVQVEVGSFQEDFSEHANAAVDISGRPFLVYNAAFSTPMAGDFPAELGEEFFRAFAMNALITLHINVPYGKNTHHILEIIFKGTGRALKEACKIEGDTILSTKGVL